MPGICPGTDKILSDKMLNGWIGMGPGRGRLKVELGHPFPEVMEDSFYEDTPDHRILVVAQYMKNNPGQTDHSHYQRRQPAYQIQSPGHRSTGLHER